MGTKTAKQGAKVGVSKKTPDGLTVAGSLAMDLVSLLREDWRSAAFAGDLTVSLPLLRG